MITVGTLVRFLAFNADAIRQIAASRAASLVGFLFVVSAGFAREYDGEYLLAEPWHLLIPVAASVVACFAMVVFVYALAWRRGVRKVGFWKTYLSFLNLYWMTAPLAWLYAIPFERFLSPGDATKANLYLLALVAAWRVALMIRCVSVMYGVKLRTAMIPVLLFADLVGMLALSFFPGPVVMIMGGVRLTESEQVFSSIRLCLSLVGHGTLIIWLICYIIILIRKTPWKWSDHQSPTDSRGASKGLRSLILASLLIWIPVLPSTQAEQSLRWQAIQLIYDKNVAELALFTNEHRESDFPPHWDPPPRMAYREKEPRAFMMFHGLEKNGTADWFLDRFREKAYCEFEIGLQFDDLTDEELLICAEVIDSLQYRDDHWPRNGPRLQELIYSDASEYRTGLYKRLYELVLSDDERSYEQGREIE